MEIVVLDQVVGREIVKALGSEATERTDEGILLRQNLSQSS